MVFYLIDNGSTINHPSLLELISSRRIRPQTVCKLVRPDDSVTGKRETAIDKFFEDQETSAKRDIPDHLGELSRLLDSGVATSESNGEPPTDQVQRKTGDSFQIETDTLRLNPESQVFEVRVNAEHFQPEGIAVKVRDGYVTLEAREEEENEKEGTYYFRRLNRKFRLPECVDPGTVTCEMTSQGLLTIKAPAKAPIIENERIVTVENQRDQQKS